MINHQINDTAYRYMPYEQLLKRYSDPNKITYQQLLQTIEWQETRSKILKRDHHCCCECKRSRTSRFTTSKILEIFKIGAKNTEWKIVGSDYRLPGLVSDGHYWMFSSNTLEKCRSAYWDQKYLTLKNGNSVFVLIKAPQQYFLQAHHHHYVINNLPWNYNDDDFQTLCNWCHWEAHKNAKVDYYERIDGELRKISLTACLRCYGAGWFPQHEHIADGICFRCQGLKFEELITKRN